MLKILSKLMPAMALTLVVVSHAALAQTAEERLKDLISG